jgi:hypothetical protein
MQVKIFFSNYTGTLEEKALSRMGKKMMAGQLLYGKDVSSVLVEDTGDATLFESPILTIPDAQQRLQVSLSSFGLYWAMCFETA